MLSIIVSWTVIGMYAYLYGKTGISILYGRRKTALHSTDVYLVWGIMLMNIFAQFFSLISGLSWIAFGFLSLVAVGCVFYLATKTKENQQKEYKVFEIVFGKYKEYKARYLLTGIAFIGTLLWTNMVPQHYDTYLYHAQAIHWCEEFGVVPGLGNLHFRLAYNSAFITLQALFSFSWLVGQSLHTVNGFLVLILSVWIIWSFHVERDNMLQVSDMLKLGLIFYFIYDSFHISSPNTDTWALSLLCYICIKWSEYAEKELEEPLPYAMLCILSVYALTLKLSAAPFVLLTLYPAVLLLRSKNWKQIIAHVGLGNVTVLPYLLRNVIISGYLIYPYPELDLFTFDWKMSVSTLIADRREVIAWGRGNKDVSRYQDALWEWMPQWYQSIHPLWRVLFLIAIVACVFLSIQLIMDIRRKRVINRCMLTVVTMIGMIFWLMSAPLPRYGVVYMLLLTCMCFGILCQGRWISEGRGHRIGCVIHYKMGTIALAGMILFFVVLYFPYSVSLGVSDQPWMVQSDYANRQTEIYNWREYEFAVPLNGDQTGYEPFPSVRHPIMLENLELRDGTLQSGFRGTQ